MGAAGAGSGPAGGPPERPGGRRRMAPAGMRRRSRDPFPLSAQAGGL